MEFVGDGLQILAAISEMHQILATQDAHTAQLRYKGRVASVIMVGALAGCLWVLYKLALALAQDN